MPFKVFCPSKDISKSLSKIKKKTKNIHPYFDYNKNNFNDKIKCRKSINGDGTVAFFLSDLIVSESSRVE